MSSVLFQYCPANMSVHRKGLLIDLFHVHIILIQCTVILSLRISSTIIFFLKQHLWHSHSPAFSFVAAHTTHMSFLLQVYTYIRYNIFPDMTLVSVEYYFCINVKIMSFMCTEIHYIYRSENLLLFSYNLN